MNKKTFFKLLWFSMAIIFLGVFIYMEVVRVDDVRQLSSNELTPEIIANIKLYSWLFNYLIFYLMVLGAYAFVSVFKLLISPNVGGNLFKVSLTVLIYISCIILTFRGYNNILRVNYFVDLTGVLSEPSIKTSYTHILILALLGIAELLKSSIRKETYQKHKSRVVKTDLYSRHLELRGIIDKKSKEV